MKVLNLTQHASTKDQDAIDLQGVNKETLIDLLNFNNGIPSKADISKKAKLIADLAVRCFIDELAKENNGISESKSLKYFDCKALIGGAPYLMGSLEIALKERGIQPVYAYSQRISEEVHKDDGTVEKINKFKHLGYIEV